MMISAYGHSSDRQPVHRAAVAIALAACLSVVASVAGAAPAIGQPAPAFIGTDSQGRSISLADYRGSIVVLEWTNHDCPFVRRHYDAGNMQALQQQAATYGVAWLTIISSAPGEQGYVSGPEADALTMSRNAVPKAVILDPSGDIGRAYAAKTTPQMFVVDAGGTLVYMGAIDDEPRNMGADPARADNYVRDALGALKAGKPVAPPVTQPYGCSVKYKS
ncbi:MAG TPA: redoxin domain-containing protein [Rhodospirillales bacterium]|nr:redoxin domain-containing protein [Rhodospirillales bacterium]